EKGHPPVVHEFQLPVWKHCLLEPFGQSDGLPDPHDFLVSGDRPGAAVNIGIALDHKHFQAELTQQVGGGGAGGAVADHRYVIAIWSDHGCLSSSRSLVL